MYVVFICAANIEIEIDAFAFTSNCFQIIACSVVCTPYFLLRPK